MRLRSSVQYLPVFTHDFPRQKNGLPGGEVFVQGCTEQVRSTARFNSKDLLFMAFHMLKMICLSVCLLVFDEGWGRAATPNTQILYLTSESLWIDFLLTIIQRHLFNKKRQKHSALHILTLQFNKVRNKQEGVIQSLRS